MTRADCPCGSGRCYSDCCGRYLTGQASATTAEQLMRSRYTAFVHRDESYLRRTWHPSSRPASLDLAGESALKWLGLKILRTLAGTEQDTHGQVLFVARYKTAGKAQRLRENSHFTREAGHWLYLYGEHDED